MKARTGGYVGESSFSIQRWALDTTDHCMFSSGVCSLQMIFSYDGDTASTKFQEGSLIKALKKSFLEAIGKLIPELNGSVSGVKFNIESRFEKGRFKVATVSGGRRFPEFADGNPNKAIVLSIFNFYDRLIKEALKRKEV